MCVKSESFSDFEILGSFERRERGGYCKNVRTYEICA